MAPYDLAFGPPESQWTYTRETKTYDLTRGIETKAPLTIETSLGPAGTRIKLAPSNTALIIVDMQNFFLDRKCRSHPLGVAAVEPTIKTIEWCRRVGIKVIWLNWGLTDSDLAQMPAAIQRGFSQSLIEGSPPSSSSNLPRTGLGSDLGNGLGRMLCAGSWNAELYAPLKEVAREDDVYCAKNRMSGLWNDKQPLWKYLSGEEVGESRTDTLLFAGVNTDQCVLGTMSDAYNAGWDVVMVEDCCATTTEGAKIVVEHNVSRSYGFVVNSESGINAV